MQPSNAAIEQTSPHPDRTDRTLLAQLSKDGRMTVTDLASRISLSVSRTQRRLRDLESAGIIRGYAADIDYAAIGFGFEAILFVTIRDLTRLPDIDTAFAEIPQVIEAQRLFGDPDYLVRIRETNLEAYQRLYDLQLARIPGVARITSTIVMKTVVEPRPTSIAP